MILRRAALALVVAGALGAPPVSAQPAEIAFTDLRRTVAGLTILVPRIVVRGVGAGREAWTRLAGPTSPGTLPERLRDLNADEVLVPQLSAETSGAAGRVTIRHRDIRLSGIKDGRAASVTADGSELTAAGPDGDVRMSIGQIAIADVDLALAASLSERSTGGAPLPLYGAVTLSDVRVTDAAGVTMRLGRLTSHDVRAAPNAAGWSAALAALSAGAAPPDETSRMSNGVLSALLAVLAGSVAFGPVEAEGFAVELPGPGRETARAGRIASTPDSALVIDDVEIGGIGGRLTVGTIMLGTPDGLAIATPARSASRALPGAGSIRLDRLALTTPDRQAVTVGTVEASLARPASSEGAASAVLMSFAARDVAMPARPGDPALKPLTDLGYPGLAGSFDGAMRYDEARRELGIDALRLRLDGMGEVKLGATLAQVAPDVFRQDVTRAAMALLGARARRLDVTIENSGLVDRLVARQARLSGVEPDDVRRRYGMAAALGAPLALGDSAAARTLGAAGGRLVERTGRVTVTFTARDAAGLGIADLLTASDPRTILDQVEVTSTP